MRPYTKFALDFAAQVDLLRTRGLVIADSVSAEAFLSRVSYYRFSAYVIPFEVRRHEIVQGTHFEDVRRLYELDGELINAFLGALGECEIAFRTRFTYVLSHAYGPFCHLDRARFRRDFNHLEWVLRLEEEVRRSKETFLDHYRTTYEGFPRLPLWMATELMSFGTLSRAFAQLEPKSQKLVVGGIGVHELVLKSWLHTTTYLRNLCAHHARLWNRELAIRPVIPSKDAAWRDLGLDNTRVFTAFAILLYLQQAFGLPEAPINRVRIALKEIYDTFGFAGKSMGVPCHLARIWLEEPCGWNRGSWIDKVSSH